MSCIRSAQRTPLRIPTWRPPLAVVIAVALVASSCGGGDGTDDVEGGVSSSAAQSSDPETTTSAAMAPPLEAQIDTLTAELLAMPPDRQQAHLAELAARFERELAALSGLEDALGGPEATDVALREAWAPIVDLIQSTAGSPIPQGLRSAPSAGPNLGEGLFAALMLGFLGADAMVTATNDLKVGETPEPRVIGDMTVTGTLATASMTVDTKQVSSKGVTTTFKATITVAPCPGPDGRFQTSAKVEISATAGSVGQTGTLDVTLDGHVDDNAALASTDTTYRMQWADFAGGKGQFVDVSGGYSGDTSKGVSINRTGGQATNEFAIEAATMAALLAVVIGKAMSDAAQKGWESGRCVQLDATASPGPSGLEPSSTSTITAAPRSKIDGGPVGGTVTATLTTGGASVDPAASPVPADATMTYTAPDQPNQGGTVALEARSRRGVGKGEITFATGSAAYLIVGGLDDFQVSEVVCDVMKPFTLTSSVGTMQLSGGLSGTYEFNGLFSSHYTGTYQITLPAGPGEAGSMIGTGSGSVAGQAGSGSENYVLTPADPC